MYVTDIANECTGTTACLINASRQFHGMLLHSRVTSIVMLLERQVGASIFRGVKECNPIWVTIDPKGRGFLSLLQQNVHPEGRLEWCVEFACRNIFAKHVASVPKLLENRCTASLVLPRYSHLVIPSQPFVYALT